MLSDYIASTDKHIFLAMFNEGGFIFTDYIDSSLELRAWSLEVLEVSLFYR